MWSEMRGKLRGWLSSGVKSLCQLVEYAAFGLLYLFQKMAEGFVSIALFNHLIKAEDTMEQASMFTIVIALPWAGKVLYAPLVDKFGTRLGWIGGATIATLLTTLSLALIDKDAMSFNLVLTLAVIQVFAVTVQDTATDALMIERFGVKKRWPVQFVTIVASAKGTIWGGVFALGLLGGKKFLPAYSWNEACVLIFAILLCVSVAMMGYLWWRREEYGGLRRPEGRLQPDDGVPVSMAKRIPRRETLVTFLLLGGVCLFVHAGAAATSPMLTKWFIWLEHEAGVGFGDGYRQLIYSQDAWLKGIAAIVAGIVANRIGIRPVFIVAALVSAAGYLSIGLTANEWTHDGVLFSVALTSVGDGAMVITLYLAAMRIAQEYRLKATVYGYFMTMMNLSEVIFKWAAAQLSGGPLDEGWFGNEALASTLAMKSRDVFPTGNDFDVGIFVLAGLALLLVIPLMLFVRLGKEVKKES